MVGRPRGRTERGEQARAELYRTAVRLFGERGYEKTTLRNIAREAGVSPGLLYKYFPSKSAVVLELYDELSADLLRRSEHLRPGPWRARSFDALEASLSVLAPYRSVLSALSPVLVGDPEQGLFSDRTAFSRSRVQGVFIEAVRGSREAFSSRDGEALGRVLYIVHLAIVLWWLLDKSPRQAATRALIALLRRLAPAASLALRLPRARATVRRLDELVREGLYGEALGNPTEMNRG